MRRMSNFLKLESRVFYCIDFRRFLGWGTPFDQQTGGHTPLDTMVKEAFLVRVG